VADQPRSSPHRRSLALAGAVCWFLAAAPTVNADDEPVPADAEPNGVVYQFVCDDGGRGTSVVDVLRATGEHETFLALFSRYDPEGFEILSDPVLADKTVWAPTDAAFRALGGAVSALSDGEIKAVLGYHITPPRRTPEGPYPIITPEYLLDSGEVVHQTRTGILTGSDQRVRTRATDGVLTVEDSTIAPTSWCTQTGSVFSIDAVITDASATTMTERVIYHLFFKSPILALTGLGVLVAGVVVLLRRRRTRRPSARPQPRRAATSGPSRSVCPPTWTSGGSGSTASAADSSVTTACVGPSKVSRGVDSLCP
jgi:uncharacterized surface protein with fasciclin (FAS1) repeats